LTVPPGAFWIRADPAMIIKTTSLAMPAPSRCQRARPPSATFNLFS
jgi:hypothetical protein